MIDLEENTRKNNLLPRRSSPNFICHLEVLKHESIPIIHHRTKHLAGMDFEDD
jgi:hypothetical protein